MEFKKKDISYITSDNLILLGHFDFSVVDLNTEKTLFEDRLPFGIKNRQISNIVYIEREHIIFLVSFNGDFAIFKIDQNNNSITKTYSYIQKGNWYYCDASTYWIDEEYLYIFLEKQNKFYFRKISYSGEIIDYDLNTNDGRYSLNCIENEQIVNFNKESKIIDSSSPNSLQFLDIADICPGFNKKNILSIFTDGCSKNLFLLADNSEIILYKKENEFIKINSFKRNSLHSKFHAKFINNCFVLLEEVVDYDKWNYKIYLTYNSLQKEFDISGYFKDDISLHLSSFNSEWISFVVKGKNIIVEK